MAARHEQEEGLHRMQAAEGLIYQYQAMMGGSELSIYDRLNVMHTWTQTMPVRDVDASQCIALLSIRSRG